MSQEQGTADDRYARISAMSESDRRLNVEGRILNRLSLHGGEQIVAGPDMERLVSELRLAFDELAIDGFLPTIREAR